MFFIPIVIILIIATAVGLYFKREYVKEKLLNKWKQFRWNGLIIMLFIAYPPFCASFFKLHFEKSNYQELIYKNKYNDFYDSEAADALESEANPTP